MQIVVKGKNFGVTDSIRDYADKRIRKMMRHFDGIISSDVTLSTERNWNIVEITVYASGFVLRGEDRTNDMYTSIDLVLDKLEKQLRKQKGKWEKRVRSQRQTEVEFPRGEEKVTGKELRDNIVIVEPEVIRVPMFSHKPMTVEEAIKEMEALAFSFFVFINARSDMINAIYRRKGGYGLIDPTYEREK
ncbi:MAG: ribosome-associated translation inhibitor RaiA [Candidatus Eremiobacteraeota bacterium]|nr:ribosome-associated translation inhibitor RaiA [Candidatus Eremiobacteraeota bacterium]